MRIGINLLTFLPNVSGGIEFYIWNLLATLAELDRENDYYLYANRDNHRLFQYDNPRFRTIRSPIGARPQVARIGWEQVVLPIMAARHRLHVLHSPSYTFPLFAPTAGVLTICDMLYAVYPETIGEPKLTYWRMAVPLSTRRCRRVLTISENSRRDIIHHLGVAPEQVVVTPLALDRRLAPVKPPTPAEINGVMDRYGLIQPYLLTVGGVGRHKNSGSLLKALALLHQRPETANLCLVITGKDYGERSLIDQTVESLGLASKVRLLGYVDRDELPALYAGAAAYVTPSLFEGFGLTLLEAMSFGAPVVASDRASLPEVAGDAALLVDPEGETALADAIYAVVTNEDLRASLRERGFERAKTFSWQRSAESTLQAYREVAIARK